MGDSAPCIYNKCLCNFVPLITIDFRLIVLFKTHQFISYQSIIINTIKQINTNEHNNTKRHCILCHITLDNSLVCHIFQEQTCLTREKKWRQNSLLLPDLVFIVAQKFSNWTHQRYPRQCGSHSIQLGSALTENREGPVGPSANTILRWFRLETSLGVFTNSKLRLLMRKNHNVCATWS